MCPVWRWRCFGSHSRHSSINGPSLVSFFNKQSHKMEQCILDVIQVAFAQLLQLDDFHSKLRQIKDLFLKRDFNSIFTDQQLLPIYAANYIPGRSLCYADIFMNLPEVDALLSTNLNVTCLGAGNGAEFVAFAATRNAKASLEPIHIHIVDLAVYGTVLNDLHASIQSTYGPDNDFSFSIAKCNLLEEQSLQSISPSISNSKLVTAMFVLNELLAASKSGFILVIKRIIDSLPVGAYFLVCDSAGSFSELEIGNTQNKYMLFTLLDHIQVLRHCAEFDAKWYRFPSHLKYPLKLHNMRYFLRLYQKK